MNKKLLVTLLVITTISILIWFSCNPFQLDENSKNSFNVLDETDSIRATGGSTFIVASSGGDFSKIQDAIDNIPENNTDWFTIIIKNGTYNEHIFIDKNFVALVGEDRKNTRIEYELDRSVWNSAMGVTNTGSGVIDIGVDSANPTIKAEVANIVIGNLTVINLVPYSSNTIYTHAIRGESTATKISIIDCDIIANGSDTLALWNTTTGMYYHANCYFQGKIDAVCPRGWCFDIGSTYVEVGNSAPIWHEGAVGSGQKFVIRNAYVKPDVPKNFKLLNGQKESIVYLLDSYFYNSDGKTIEKGSVYASYFFNCHMEGGDQSWHQDNLSSAPGAPSQNIITASWTFNNQWDPENSLPAVLPYAAIPQPWDKAYEIPNNIQLKWLKARDAVSYNVYIGETTTPNFILNTTDNYYQTAQLSSGKKYYWRIDTITPNGVIVGKLWSFTTL